MPDASVVDVAAAKLPELGSFVQVTTRPAVRTGAPYASSNRALTVIGCPMTGAVAGPIGDAVTTYWEAAPTLKFTAAVCESAEPPSDAVTVAVCAPPKVDRSVAMYRPFALSVTAESVPFVVDIVRVPPDAWSAVPAASRSCTVIMTVLVPFAGMLCAPA